MQRSILFERKHKSNENNNHSLYICDYFNKDKKNKKTYHSKDPNHKENMSEQKHNYSFHSINLSNTKSKKLKIGISEKNIKNPLFHPFSITFKRKSCKYFTCLKK